MLLHLSCLSTWQLGSNFGLGDGSNHSPGSFGQSPAFVSGNQLLCLLFMPLDSTKED